MIKNHERVLDSIILSLKERGASSALLIDISNIVIDERVRLKCQVPLCGSYRNNLMCPPYVPSVTEFHDALKLYSSAIILQVTAELKNSRTDIQSEEIFSPAKKLHELVNFAEKKAFSEGYRFATGFIGGCCRLCDECVAIHGGKQCRFPFKARPSMEAVGIDVITTAEKVGLPISFPIINKVTWMGLILIE
jgi:predicted metal-binding protein